MRIGIGIVVAIGIDIEDIPVWINLEMAVNVGSCPARNRREKDDYNNQDDSKPSRVIKNNGEQNELCKLWRSNEVAPR